MPTDYPDYTLPIVVIGTVTVTGAVTVSGTVAISGTVTVTGAVTVSGTVAISGTVTVTGTVAVSGTVTVTGAVTVSGTVAISGSVTVTGSVTVSGTVAISGTVTVTGAVTVTGSVTVSGTVAVSGTVTVTGSVTVSGTVAISGSVAVTGTVAVSGTVTVTGTVAVSGTVTVAGAVTVSGTVAVSGTVTVSGTVAVSGTVTVTGAVTVSGTVAVSGTVTVAGSVTVSGTVAVSGTVTVTGTVAVSGTVTVSGAVTVSGTVAISGSVAVTGSVTVSGTVGISGSVTVTGAVTISGPVTVATVAADNIVIDKLTVGAYTERRSTLSNNGASASMHGDASSYRGKFFTRGARGFIETIDVYCDNSDGSPHNIIIDIAPYPGMGPVITVTLAVGAGAAAAWRSATVKKMWTYDSMFIWVVCDNATYPRYGYDVGTPPDTIYSVDAEVTWQSAPERQWFRAVMVGETCGDVPVSGTVNNIEIPSSTTSGVGANVTVHTNTETSIASVTGAGKIARIHLYTTYENMAFHFYIDGVMLNVTSFTGHFEFAPSSLKVLGFTASTPKIQLLRYDVGGYYDIGMDIQFNFKRSFEIKAYHEAGSDRIASVSIVANLIS